MDNAQASRGSRFPGPPTTSAAEKLLAEAERQLPASDRFAAVAHVSEVLFAIVNQLSAEMTREFSRAHAAWVTSSAAVRMELVQEVLDGKPVAADHAHRVLGYDLTRRHTALVVWADDLEQADPGRLAGCAEQLLRAGGATGTLILPVGRQRVWAWGSSVQGASVAPPTSTATPRSGIRVAAGLPESGVEGFAFSHHQAFNAVRVGMLSRTDRWLFDYAELDVIAMLSTHLDEARRFVRRELGGLAGSGEPATTLRTTLKCYRPEAPRRHEARGPENAGWRLIHFDLTVTKGVWRPFAEALPAAAGTWTVQAPARALSSLPARIQHGLR